MFGAWAKPPAVFDHDKWAKAAAEENLYSHKMKALYEELQKEKEAAKGMAIPAAMLGAASQKGGLQGHNPYNQHRYTVAEKLMMRLNIARNETHSFDFMQAVENPKGGNVIVFIINNGQPIHLEDDPVMFPSDRLIGQINTLR